MTRQTEEQRLVAQYLANGGKVTSDDPAYLSSRFSYDADTGRLFHKEKTGNDNSRFLSVASWNRRFAGKFADGKLDTHGYRCVRAQEGKYRRAHRVIWQIVHSVTLTPDQQIDHINGDRADNRITNLRVVSNKQNHRNTKLFSNNTSGAHGVVWSKQKQRWLARIRQGSKQVHLGSFLDKSEAIAVRAKAQLERGFHPNHGVRK